MVAASLRCSRCTGMLQPPDEDGDRYCLNCGSVQYAEAPLPWRPRDETSVQPRDGGKRTGERNDAR